MAATLEQLESLERAIAEGATSVRYLDREVRYRSLEEMERIRMRLRRELGLDGASIAPRRILAEFDRGHGGGGE